MRVLALIQLSILSLVLVSCSKPNLKTAEEFGSGILGGRLITAGERGQSVGDYAVSVVGQVKIPNSNEFSTSLCTGSLIEKDLVLTAAHCLDRIDTPENLRVIFDEDLSDLIEPVGLVKAFVIHPKARPQYEVSYDIALIRLTKPAPHFKKRVELPTATLAEPFKRGGNFEAVGFGTTHGSSDPYRDRGAGLLRSVSVTARAYAGNQMWLVDQRSGSGICEGDSGGPLLAQIHGQTYVFGVAHASNQAHPTEEMIKAILMNKMSFAEYMAKHPEFDSCRDESQYTSVIGLLPWINSEKSRL